MFLILTLLVILSIHVTCNDIPVSIKSTATEQRLDQQYQNDLDQKTVNAYERLSLPIPSVFGDIHKYIFNNYQNGNLYSNQVGSDFIYSMVSTSNLYETINKQSYAIMATGNTLDYFIVFKSLFQLPDFVQFPLKLEHLNMVVDDPHSDDRFVTYVDDHNNIYKFEYETPSDNQIVRYSIEAHCESKMDYSKWCFGKTVQRFFNLDREYKDTTSPATDISLFLDENGKLKYRYDINQLRNRGYEFLLTSEYIIRLFGYVQWRSSLILTFDTDELASEFFEIYFYKFTGNNNRSFTENVSIKHYKNGSIKEFSFYIEREAGSDWVSLEKIKPDSNKWKFTKDSYIN